MRFDLTSLRLFVAVAQELNITRAAEREHLVLSAASKRITELENMITQAEMAAQAPNDPRVRRM